MRVFNELFCGEEFLIGFKCSWDFSGMNMEKFLSKVVVIYKKNYN